MHNMGTNYQILGWVRSTMAYCKVHDNQAYKKAVLGTTGTYFWLGSFG